MNSGGLHVHHLRVGNPKPVDPDLGPITGLEVDLERRLLENRVVGAGEDRLDRPGKFDRSTPRGENHAEGDHRHRQASQAEVDGSIGHGEAVYDPDRPKPELASRLQ